MKLIIAEKPELARAIVTAIEGKEIDKKVYIEKGDYTVTWAFGHMLQLKDPEDYDIKYKKWSIEPLPLYFENWEHKISDKEKDEYKAKQLKVIEELLNRCDEVIHAGDPDSEGQYLIDEILQFYNNKKPVKRILINDNNTEYIKKAFTKLEDNQKYISMGISAYARSVADMLLGINATRLYTCLNGSGELLTVGRVQTPTLGLVVNRDYAIENHVKEKYYELSITANNRDKTNNIVFMYQKTKETPVNEDKLITDITFLENIKNEIEDTTLYNVKVSSKIKNENAPLPFNLAKLQAYCSQKYGYSAQQTQDITQSLREKHKAITYNRSDSQYLNEDHFLEAPEKLQIIFKNLNITVDRIDTTKKSKCFDNSKVTAHHAIIPTMAEIDISKLSKEELNVYEAIADFYIIQFLPPQVIKEKTGEFKVKEYEFKTTGRKIMDLGYKKYLNNTPDEEEEKEQEGNSGISEFEDGNYEFINFMTNILPKETKPLKAYTESTLLMDMTRVSKYIVDPEIKEILLRKDEGKKGENGSIGTPATRATIINELFKRGYITRVGKTIKATKKGKEFYNSLPSVLQTADMTALWWTIQEEIIENTKTADDLILSVLETVKTVLTESRKNLMKSNTEKCPNCETGYLIAKTGKHGAYWSCIDCSKNYPDKEGKPDFTEKKPAEKSDLKCPKDNGILYKNEGKHGYYWRCGSCKETYKDKDGTPELEKKDNKKSGHKCGCGADLIERKAKNTGKIWYGCSKFPKCKRTYFPQDDGSIKEAVKK